jgi:hypothetical protein
VEELAVDNEFLLSQAFMLADEAIALSHIVSKTKDSTFQSGIAEVCNGPVNKGTTGVSGMEDLEGVVLKEPWFTKIWGGARVGMKVPGIDLCVWSLTSLNLWIG